MLWFGDERGYNATDSETTMATSGCGLVMKEDITQPEIRVAVGSLVVVW